MWKRRPTSRRTRNRTKLRVATLVFLAVVIFSRMDTLMLMWKTRYRRLNCPVSGFWIRKPKIESTHLTGKFRILPDHFLDKIQEHVDTVVQSGVYDRKHVISYASFPSFITQDDKWKQHLTFLERPRHHSKRGAGYWFWKPALIQHHLKQMKDDDFLLYADVDRVDFVSWTALLLETMVSRKADLAVELMSFREQAWTKGDVYKALNCGLPKDDETFQYNGSFFLIRKNTATTEFVDKWVDLASNYHLIADERDRHSVTRNARTFEEHRHDQSLMSMLLKCTYGEPKKQAFQETCLGDWTLYTFQLLQRR